MSVDHALNTVVVKCHTGMAQAVCAKLDKLGLDNVVGTLAGDDTIFILYVDRKRCVPYGRGTEILIIS